MISDVGNDCTSVEIWGEIGINDRRIWLATKWPQLLLQQQKKQKKTNGEKNQRKISMETSAFLHDFYKSSRSGWAGELTYSTAEAI